jgi:radical SAM protein with 4Fe4S-binding SPASM domain
LSLREAALVPADGLAEEIGGVAQAELLLDAGAGAEGALSVEGLVVHGEDDHCDSGMLLRDEGVDKMSFIPFHDIGVLADGEPRMSRHKIRPEEMVKLDAVIDELVRVKRREGIIDSSAAYLCLFKHCFRDRPLPIACYAGYASICVDGYGDMYPCFPQMEIGAAQAGVANVREIALRNYWKSPRLQESREAIRGCRKCYWNNQTELSLMYHFKGIPDPGAETLPVPGLTASATGNSPV